MGGQVPPITSLRVPKKTRFSTRSCDIFYFSVDGGLGQSHIRFGGMQVVSKGRGGGGGGESTSANAKSILLTEDNLITLHFSVEAVPQNHQSTTGKHRFIKIKV